MQAILWVLIAVTAIAGALASGLVYYLVSSILTERVVDRAELVAASIDPEIIRKLSGSEADLANPAYIGLKGDLTALREANSDIRFVYVMALAGDSVIFLADSEPADSEDYSPPGQEYFEASDILYDSLRFGTIGYEVERDRWGYWLSGLAPVKSRETGKVLAVAGVDIDATKTYIPSLVTYAALPLATAAAVGFALIAAYILVQAQRQQVLERIESLSIASHEIRTPLTGILWATENLLAAQLSDADRQKVLAINGSARDVTERVNNLLTMHMLDRNHPLRPAPVPVSDVLAEVAQTYTLAAAARSIRLSVDPALPKQFAWNAEKDKIRLVLANLTSNAIKYGKEGTTIRYAFDAEHKTLTVENEGIGIPAADMPHIFDGYRAENASESGVGNGLGLALVKRVVELHFGTVKAHSVLGGTTRFTLFIPSVPPPNR